MGIDQFPDAGGFLGVGELESQDVGLEFIEAELVGVGSPDVLDELLDQDVVFRSDASSRVASDGEWRASIAGSCGSESLRGHLEGVRLGDLWRVGLWLYWRVGLSWRQVARWGRSLLLSETLRLTVRTSAVHAALDYRLRNPALVVGDHSR